MNCWVIMQQEGVMVDVYLPDVSFNCIYDLIVLKMTLQMIMIDPSVRPSK